MRTVLIVDDHTGFRGFARRLLETGGFRVVGEARDEAWALEAVEELRPELGASGLVHKAGSSP